jgi:hypothetical protein
MGFKCLDISYLTLNKPKQYKYIFHSSPFAELAFKILMTYFKWLKSNLIGISGAFTHNLKHPLIICLET